jgi:hypothetical protein
VTDEFPFAISVHQHASQGPCAQLRFATREAAEAQLTAYKKALDDFQNYRSNEATPSVHLTDDNGSAMVIYLKNTGALELIEMRSVWLRQEEMLLREAEMFDRFPHLKSKK